MNFLDWLLDLDKVSLSDGQPLSLEWGRALPPWLVVGLAAIAVLMVVFLYRRERASAGRVAVLAAMRLALVLLVGAVLCKPALIWKRVRTASSSVVLLVDNSSSMAAQDAYADGEDDLRRSIVAGAGLSGPEEAERLSRLDSVRAAITRDAGSVLDGLLSRHRVQLASFSNAVTDMALVGQNQPPDEIVEGVKRMAPDGALTDLSGAITATIEKWADSRLAGIVLVSDGQATTQHDLRPALELAARRGVPIYPVRVGSGVAPVDVEVSPPRAATTVLANDVVTVGATVSVRGLARAAEVEVKLLDVRESGEEVVATETVTLSPEKPDRRVELEATPTAPGVHEFRVQAAAVPNERVIANNADAVQVRVIDDRVRVLYVEGYPRYEYRYLKNALVRERTVDLSVLLLEADERFVQEGTTPIRRFPDTPEALNRYDVVLFGDVDPKGGWLSQTQMVMLLDFVANEGGGFGVIAGERTAPQRFLGTPLEKLLPVTEGPRLKSLSAGGFNLELTPEGKSNRVFKFVGEPSENEAVIAGLPQMYWALPNVQAKPGATVLAQSGGASALPLIVAGQYGGGRLFFQATDDTWRWRRHTGEFLHDSYWVQVVRFLMPTSRLSPESGFAIRTDRRVYGYGDPVQVNVEMADPTMPRNQQEVRLIVEQMGQEADGGSEEAAITARRTSFDPDVFDASFVPPSPGSFTIRPADGFGKEGKSRSHAATIRVSAPDMESRRPAADHKALELIAASTGGQVVPLDRLGEVLGDIPDRSLLIPDDVEEPLWDSKLVLVLFVSVIGLEWILRKAFGLL
jgi:uncharacterized membrane protein